MPDNDVVIAVENLSKQYKLGTIGHGTLYRDLQSWWARLRGQEDPNSTVTPNFKSQISNFAANAADDFWALRDVSFEVKRGEVLGIIGRNGAGKSTLLKILSRVTGPTKGNVKIKGRVASLLEVGTGFHPELTGRENIYLNGTILGMKKKEIDAKFDEIVAFAEIEQFIDTPVKRYSSGMYVRLAFAVAAHLEPEILIVDEVLAVGDAAFQKKCLGKMGEVSREGRTVLFVSHDMGAVTKLCTRVLHIDKGLINYDGDTAIAVSRYLAMNTNLSACSRYPDKNAVIYFRSLLFENNEGKASCTFASDEPIIVAIEYVVTKKVSGAQIVLHLHTKRNEHLFSSADIDLASDEVIERIPGIYKAKVIIPANIFAPRIVVASVACGIPNVDLLDIQDGPDLEITAGANVLRHSGGRKPALVALPLNWETKNLNEDKLYV